MYDSNMTKEQLLEILNIYLSEDEEPYEELKAMETKAYINSTHFQALSKLKRKSSPVCEACNKRTTSRVFMKHWDCKGKETLDDLVSLCYKCLYEHGQLIAYEDIEGAAVKNIYESVEIYDEVFTEIALVYVRKKARGLLSGKEYTKNILKEDLLKAVDLYNLERK